MIFYAEDYERWEDTEDPKFNVSMTPEGSMNPNKCEFESQADFWEWFNEYSNPEVL